MPRLSDFKVLSFDCYGTLIDWETGIWNAVQPLIAANADTMSREQALADFGIIEPIVEHEHPKLLYRDLLAKVHGAMASHWKLKSTAALDTAFGLSIPDWPAFPDTRDALAWLKQHYRLVILSNVDRQSFAATNMKLGVTFDAIRTAEDIGTYKPDPRNFEDLLQTVAGLGHPKTDLLHVAQSLFHDIVPAEQLGIRRCWINRRGDTGTGSGATKAVARMPALDFTFSALGALADARRNGQF
jgi:2-haloacid dehalogenase